MTGAIVSVQIARDDDFVGWVFGFQDPTHFYVAQWKRRDQFASFGRDQDDYHLSRAGLTIKR